ncbi:hypothetical protein LCGC14_1898030 [marine sediment metagenome]|uniref:Uncharacterized protein n=1 Tax=marine sediment metagenome TaxID=412755 RepID=A0A0F9GKT0_9ZZZZ
MLYINNYHWIWYGLGFMFIPRTTIMIVLSLHFPNFIPLPLMILGWVFGIFWDDRSGNKNVKK